MITTCKKMLIFFILLGASSPSLWAKGLGTPKSEEVLLGEMITVSLCYPGCVNGACLSVFFRPLFHLQRVKCCLSCRVQWVNSLPVFSLPLSFSFQLFQLLAGGSRHSYISPPWLTELWFWQKRAVRGGDAAGEREVVPAG